MSEFLLPLNFIHALGLLFQSMADRQLVGIVSNVSCVRLSVLQFWLFCHQLML